MDDPHLKKLGIKDSPELRTSDKLDDNFFLKQQTDLEMTGGGLKAGAPPAGSVSHVSKINDCSCFFFKQIFVITFKSSGLLPVCGGGPCHELHPRQPGIHLLLLPEATEKTYWSPCNDFTQQVQGQD